MVRSLAFLIILVGSQPLFAQPYPWHGLRFSAFATSWDEGIPLGNGLVGALLWQKGNSLRLSLDRADLWDMRPIPELERPELKYSWIIEQVRRGDIKPVQQLTDLPYGRDAAPTKIPAAALEFPLELLGPVRSVRLSLDSATCFVEWANGARCMMFIHATSPEGWFRFDNLPVPLLPDLVPPPYAAPAGSPDTDNPTVDGQDLRRLNYPPPQITRGANSILYRQTGFGNFRYEVALRWISSPGGLLGVWSVSADPSYAQPARHASDEVAAALGRGFSTEYSSHLRWWKTFWERSTIAIPDSLLERQWYLDTYKFGAASRRGSPPITLQAIWTADNGKLPPWRGDFHHDLNTQLSYWPCYSGNRLDDGLAFLDWLWQTRPAARTYTQRVFGTSGLNFPGVSTLAGEQMGGWMQYSFSPTVSAWLAHHFYLHWRYSMDRDFLKTRAYPWIQETATHLEQLSVRDANGKRKLPLSSSPEINDNRITAWFEQTTNYDLALVRWAFSAAAELAEELGFLAEASHWRVVLSEWPDFALSAGEKKLLVAPGTSLKESHRHFSHLMAIHPLGLLDRANGERDREIIGASLADLKRLGTNWWVGYSFAWAGSMYARARYGDEAAEALRTFARCFVLPNSFHANGDQSRSGKSKFTYRPVTLEGNFAFAQGIQEMLLQSQNGRVAVFPAIPSGWRDAHFSTLRAEGAFLVSASLQNGAVRRVRIRAEQGGTLRLADPFGAAPWRPIGIARDRIGRRNELLEIVCTEGEEFDLVRSE
jgi:alpha-L-fucosidase 2